MITAPVERFIRQVLPAIPGGFRQVASAPLAHVPLICRAAEASGLSLQEVGDTTYFYEGRRAVGGVHQHRITTMVGKHAITVCDSKAHTRQMLQAAGLPTPRGVALSSEQLHDAFVHARGFGLSVLKPSYGMRGRGITIGIATDDGLRAAWETARSAHGNDRHGRFVLEEQIEGIDLRVFVVGRRVAAAATRVPAHVIGDGRLSIAALVEMKEQRRNQNAYLVWPLTVDTEYLARVARTQDDVPGAGEIVLLNGLANLHLGGENVDVTDLVHPDLLALAVDATRAVPGLNVAGVDLMAPDLHTIDGAVVLELNAGANIQMHHSPTYGQERDVARVIIEEMRKSAAQIPL